MKPYNMIFLPLVYSQILDFPGTVYVDNCYPYQCSLQGICSNLTDNTFYCDCYTSYDGDDCSTTLTSCDDVDCGDQGTCLYDDAEPTCYCEWGWERESQKDLLSPCNVERIGYSACDVYDCGGKGECYISEGEAQCNCDAGWGGDTCSWETNDMLNMYLLEIAALLTDEYPSEAKNIAYDCSYVWPFVWDEAPVAESIGQWTEAVSAPCTCISAIRTVAAESWENFYQWRLDQKYKWNIEKLWQLHCPSDTTEDQVQEFIDVLSSFSDDCKTVLSESSSFPLYLENRMLCSCLITVADRVSDPEEFLQYPLNLAKPYSSAYMNYLACTSEEGICDFEEIYHKITLDTVTYPKLSDTCGPVVLKMAKSYDSNEYKDDMCDCIMNVAEYCLDCGTEYFDCRSSHWDWWTVEQRFKELCFSSKKIWREYAWTMNRYAMQLMSIDIVGASSCSNALMTSLARAQVPFGIDSKINNTFCDCLSSLEANGFDNAWGEIMAVAPTGFYIDADYCVGYTDLFGNVFSVDTSSTSASCKTQLVIMGVLCVLILVNAIILMRSVLRRKAYKKLETNKVGAAAVDYKTTNSI